jgi:hypothetical protein
MFAQFVAIAAVLLVVFWNLASRATLAVVMVAPVLCFLICLFYRIEIAHFPHRKRSLRVSSYSLLWLVNPAVPLERISSGVDSLAKGPLVLFGLWLPFLDLFTDLLFGFVKVTHFRFIHSWIMPTKRLYGQLPLDGRSHLRHTGVWGA